MSCCGQKRDNWRVQADPSLQGSAGNPGVVYFRYVGKSALTAVGAITGRVYRFAGPGSVAATDPRDAPSIAATPHLVQIRHP